MSAQMSTPASGAGVAALGPAQLVLTATAARRFYRDEASKSEIAAELGVSRFKVARMLRQARETGLVRIELDYRGELDLELSVALAQRFGLRHCLVMRAEALDDVSLRAAIGRATAGLLGEIVTADDILGLAGGRALMATRNVLTRLAPCTVVQMSGAVTQENLAESSIELVRDIAQTGGGAGHYFYAPMVMPDARTAQALRTQHDVARASAFFGRLTKAIVGIGRWAPGRSNVADMVGEAERVELYERGARAEVCGLLLDAQGEAVPSALADRRMGISAAELQAVPEVIGLVYNLDKAPAAYAAIRSGYVKSLVTHVDLARALLALG